MLTFRLVPAGWFDFVLDGVGLHGLARLGDHTSVLRPGHLVDDVTRLLGEGPPSFADGRQALFVCPLCGDLGCGALSVWIEHTGDEVVWTDFAWQTPFDELWPEGYEHLGPYRFPAGGYRAALLALLQRERRPTQPKITGR
ncbi:hypothetical protein JOF53_002468 [Crossiella equi]|uniref:Oxidoreductase n=1 Tax=Crossiella equi TaxID=130796 RepID=A0ABS5AAI9_9PSEU|nr:hypothetical protein [Crossiella equi]MBP2473596.1 hypothetical protein [Crossiella equi]